MSGLDSIAVTTEPPGSAAQEWGNAMPVLHEIRHGLARLAQTGESTLIDLRAMPFGPGDEDRLLALLGTGEVQANLEALGTTRILESAVPGVWLVDHYNAENERIALHIEIGTVPGILCTQPEDVRAAVGLLDARLAERAIGATE